MAEQKPNVLFVTADQWRGECLSVLGHPVIRTPGLDALAQDGVLFKRHYAQAAPCGPSRASLHTGMYLMNHRSGTNGTPLDARHTNWAKEVRKLGYDPVLFGYTDTSQDPRFFDPDDPILRSYEGPLPGITPVVMMGTYPTQWGEWLAAKGYDVPDPVHKMYLRKKDQPEWEDGGPCPAPLDIPAEHHDTVFMVDQVVDYIEQQQDKSWCVHLSLLRPHPPWIAPEPYNAMYDPAELPDFIRAESREAEGEQHPWLKFQTERPYYRTPDSDKKLRRLKSSYFGLMTEVDTELTRLWNYLKREGLYDNTLIIFTSDHGEQLGDHWLLGKSGYFEESYHVPLIIRDPRPAADATRGATVDAFTENIDIMPTILGWSGAEIPVQCDGKSLQPFLADPATPDGWRDAAHWEFDFRDPVRGAPENALGITMHQCTMNILRDDRYKYVHFTALPPLLFDLHTDPHEFVNLAEDPAHQHVVREYAQRMLSWRMNHDEQTLTHMTITDDGVFSRPAARY